MIFFVVFVQLLNIFLRRRRLNPHTPNVLRGRPKLGKRELRGKCVSEWLAQGECLIRKTGERKGRENDSGEKKRINDGNRIKED